MDSQVTCEIFHYRHVFVLSGNNFKEFHSLELRFFFHFTQNSVIGRFRFPRLSLKHTYSTVKSGESIDILELNLGK